MMFCYLTPVVATHDRCIHRSHIASSTLWRTYVCRPMTAAIAPDACIDYLKKVLRVQVLLYMLFVTSMSSLARLNRK